VSDQENVKLEVKVLRITPKAYLIETYVDAEESAEPQTVEEWVPKSQVVETDCLAEGDEGTMEITAWIAKQKGWLEDDE
jgi:hypothetical protein